MELALDLLLAVAFEDSGVGLHHLAERPERDALAVREAAAVSPGSELLLVFDPIVEHEAALADPRHAHESDELRRALLPRPIERAREQLELAPSADELAAVHALDVHTRARAERKPRWNRLALPLRRDRFRFFVVDRA